MSLFKRNSRLETLLLKMAALMGHFRRFTSTNFTSVLCRIQENRGASYSFKLCKLNQLLRFSHEGGNVYAFICVFLAFILNDHVVHAEFVRHVIHRVTHSAMISA